MLRYSLCYCLLIFLLSCSAEKKISKAVSVFDKHKTEAARYCESRFPLKDSVMLSDTVFISGDLSYYKDLVDTLLRQTVHLKDETITSELIAAESREKCMEIVKNLMTRHQKLAKKADEIMTVKPTADTVLMRSLVKVRDRRVEIILQADLDLAAKNAAKFKEAYYKAKISAGRWKIAAIVTWALLAVLLAVRFALRRKI